METTKIIRVEQKHIDAGVRGSCGCCPVALALQEVLPLANLATNGHYVWQERGSPLMPIGWLDQEALTFVHDFDSGQPVQPFEFTYHPMTLS